MRVDAGADGENLRLCRFDVRNGQIEVKLLWVHAARPGRFHPVFDALERKCLAPLRVLGPLGWDESCPVVIAFVLHLPTENARIELCKIESIRAVEHDEIEFRFRRRRVAHEVGEYYRAVFQS